MNSSSGQYIRYFLLAIFKSLFPQVMVVIGVLYIDVVGAAGSWRWLSVSCIALCVLWDGILLVSIKAYH